MNLNDLNHASLTSSALKEKVLEAWMADTTSEIDSFGTTRTEGKVHIGLRIAQSSSPIP